jgi:uncharacterized membrane protein (UPF0127 family)
MKIVNRTRNTILAQDIIVADAAFERMKGLLGRKDFRQGEALIIKPCNSIHTFFMHFPIDVLFVDKHSSVIKAISALAPFRLTSIYFNAAFVIELPVGTIQSSSTAKGDTLLLE